jgi:hypothetical protein
MTAFNGIARPEGTVTARVIRAARPNFWWRVKNFRHWFRGWWKHQVADKLGIAHLHGQIEAVLVRADGTRVNYGVVSHRVVTTAYVTALATNQFDGSSPDLADFDYHDCGTGTNAEAAGDTALQTPYGGARTDGTPTNPGAGQYRNTGTVNFTGSLAITEHGLFSASSSGTLMDRSVFAAINVGNGDAIEFQYTITYSAGG